jgi:hypothetical protein
MLMTVCANCGRRRPDEQTVCDGCGGTVAASQGDRLPSDNAYHEIHHIVRTVSAMGKDGTVSGDHADRYIASWLQDGWRLLNDRVIDLGLSPSGLTLMWVMVR